MKNQRCFVCRADKWRWFEGDLTTRFVQLCFYVFAAAIVGGAFSWVM